MRKYLLPFALTGLISLPLAACDVEEGEGDTITGDTSDTSGGDTDTTQPDTTPTVTYRAIIVDDSEIFPTHRTDPTQNPCATAGFNNTGDGAHGADIDAVGLFDPDGTTLVGYFDTIDGAIGTQCDGLSNYTPNRFTDINNAKGTPDATLTSGFVSLSGGALTGEFDGGVELLEDDVVVIYEVGSKDGGTDEGYHVFVSQRLDCLNGGSRASCQFKVTGSQGAKGEAPVTLSGF